MDFNFMDRLAPGDARATLQAAVLEVAACLSSGDVDKLSEGSSNSLVAAVSRLRSECGQVSWSSSSQQAEDAWSHACALWNAAVDAANKGVVNSCKTAAVQVAWLRHMACELLHDVPAGQLQGFQLLQLVTFCIKASAEWTKLDMWEQSDVVLAFASKAADAVCRTPLQHGTAPAHKSEQLCTLMFDVAVARYLTTTKLAQQVAAAQALASARAAAEDLAPSPAISSRLCTQLAAALHSCVSEAMLAMAADAEGPHVEQVLTEPLSTAFELLTKVKAQHENQQQGGNSAATAAAPAVKASPTSELVQQLQQLESRVLLDMAYCHLTFGKDPGSCLRCIDALRQLETPEGWSHPAVGLLALQAFLASGNAQQAETEASGVAVNDGADVSMCTAIILELLQAPVHMPEGLSTVLKLVLGRFPSDPSILVTFIQHALTAAAAATASATAATAAAPPAGADTTADGAAAVAVAAASYGRELEQLVLHVLKNHQGPCEAAKADQGLAGRLHVLLYNHGVAKFEAKSFETAVEFFAASLDFAEGPVKASVSRVLVTCHLLLRQHTQAASYCSLAESYQPSVVATSFLRFKLLLLQGDEDGLVAEVSRMVSCSDFHPSMLHLACQEAMAENAMPAARAALLKLLHVLQQQQQQGASVTDAADGSKAGSSSSSQVPESWVLRALVKLDSEELDRHCKEYATQKAAATTAAATAMDAEAAAAAAAGAETGSSKGAKHTAAAQTLLQPGAQEPQASGQPGTDAAGLAAAAVAAAEAAATRCAVKLSEVLHIAVARSKALGVEVFSGDREAEGCRLLEWMSTIAWNAGLAVTALDDKQPVAVLMHASAELLAQLPALGPQHMKQQKMAYLNAAAAALEVHMAMPQHNASLKLAKKMCTAVKGVSSRLLSGGAVGPSDAGGLPEAFMLQMLFRVALQQQNTPEQLVLVQQLVEHPAISADLMHKVADHVNKHPHRCPEVFSAVLEGVLRKLMASSSPDWHKVADTMRQLVQQAASDADKLRHYRECASIVSMLPKASFPDRELSWLVSTAWNTGMHHARFDRHSAAAEYMGVAASLLPCCTRGCGISSTQQGMMREAQLKHEQLAAKNSTGGAAAIATGLVR